MLQPHLDCRHGEGSDTRGVVSGAAELCAPGEASTHDALETIIRSYTHADAQRAADVVFVALRWASPRSIIPPGESCAKGCRSMQSIRIIIFAVCAHHTVVTLPRPIA